MLTATKATVNPISSIFVCFYFKNVLNAEVENMREQCSQKYGLIFLDGLVWSQKLDLMA